MPSSFRLRLLWIVVALANIVTPTAARSAAPAAASLRRPVAICLSHDQRLAITVNRQSGSLSVIDLEKEKAVGETTIGRQLSALAPLADRRRLLVTDEAAHELVVVEPSADDPTKYEARHRTPVSPYPVGVTTTGDGRRAVVASLWSRRVTLVDLPATADAAPRVLRTLDLSFAPRSLLLVDGDRRLIAADSFGGRLAVIDMGAFEQASATTPAIREFPGHNVRGLGVSSNGKMLVVAHQMLNDYAHSNRNDVHWGLLMSNDLRWLRLERVLDQGGDLYVGGHMHPLGHAGEAMGDPSGLAVAPDGKVVVSVGGTNEIAYGKEGDFSLQRLAVGKRPTGVVVSSDSRRAYTANTFGDSISVIDLENDEVLREISLGPARELTQAERGELLFYDARISHDGWMSCQSCHSDGHSNGQLNDNLGDATFGAPKRVLSLLGRADTAPFAWNGSSKTLAEQIGKSIANTMQSDETPTPEEIGQLVAYVESLKSPPSVDELRGTVDRPAIARGRGRFESLGCVACHAPPSYTTPKTYDVGLRDKLGNTKFNPPPLRGVGQRAPYFHDNRAATLADVFVEHQHQLEKPLDASDLADLLAFLRSL